MVNIQRVWIALVAAMLATATGATSFGQNAPGPEHAKLKEFEGAWDAAMQFGPVESKGSMTFKMTLGGLWLASDFEGTFEDQKFSGKGFDTFDATSKKYISVWCDSMSTRPMTLEGTYDAAGKVLTMTGEGPGPDGKLTKYKMVYDHKDKNKFVQTMFGPGPDGNEAAMFTITYTRKK